jgi:DNA modification methylase
MNIEWVKTKDIIPNENNPRILKDDKFKKLVQSIKDFPEMLEIRPIVVNNEMMILGGNMRWKAIQEIGIKEIPIIKAENLTEEQQREFLIKDNVGFGEWDWDALANDWNPEELNEWGLDVPNMDLTELEAEDDNFEEPENVETDIVLGDLFEIGEHRLLCGDSTDSDAIAKLMNGEKADMVFTSPPYNSGDVAMRGGGNFAFGKKGAKTLYENYKDDKTPQEYFDFCISILNNISLIVNELHSVFWNVSYNANSRDDYGKIVFSDVNPFRVKETIIWNKGIAIPITSEGILSRNSEFVFLMSNGEKYLTNQKIGGKSVYWNTWNISSSGSQYNEHKACFPIELPFRAIEDFSKKNHIVYEPFTGSGTTMVASHQLKRKCYGMELDPKYCQVIIDRMKKLDPTLKIKRNGVEI